jgi:PTH1 family peptidyl-tRNA hydrolase
LFKPGVNMNSNGIMVKRFLDRIGGRPEQCTLVHDDADLPLGEIRAKPEGGGDAGHKGVRSVISALETVAVPRLRLGICPSGAKMVLADYVLATFTPEAEASYWKMIEAAAAQIRERARVLFGAAAATTDASEGL